MTGSFRPPASSWAWRLPPRGGSKFWWPEPVEGALLEEAIDVAVILDALRALRALRISPSVA